MIIAEFTNEINDLTTENLYQWDTYQSLLISGIDIGGVAPKVHFCNKKSTEALVVQSVIASNNSATVSIPNTLLKEKYDILAYIYTNTGVAGKTIKSITIPVIARLKPSEYVEVTNEDLIEIEQIELQAKLILNGLKAENYNNTKTYKRPNIVFYENASYMCTVDSEISGVLPTDSDKWQVLCYGSVIVDITETQNGKLAFVFDNGETIEMNFELTNASTTDAVVQKVLLWSGKLNCYGNGTSSYTIPIQREFNKRYVLTFEYPNGELECIVPIVKRSNEVNKTLMVSIPPHYDDYGGEGIYLYIGTIKTVWNSTTIQLDSSLIDITSGHSYTHQCDAKLIRIHELIEIITI